MEDIGLVLKYFGIFSSYTKYYKQVDEKQIPLY